jgi:hypothetical protein
MNVRKIRDDFYYWQAIYMIQSGQVHVILQLACMLIGLMLLFELSSSHFDRVQAA